MGYSEKSGAIPPLPSSLNANTNTWEMVDLGNPAQAKLPRPYPDTDPVVTPYLGLRARLSQVWFNRWTVLLLLVLVRVLLLTTSLNEDLGDAKTKALSACSKVEDVGSAMASMPHYLSVGVNSLAASGIEKAVRGLVSMLDMVVTGVKAILLFIINFYLGTYACLISAFIHGGLDVAAKVIDAATNKINEVLAPIADGLNGEIQDFVDKVNSFAGSIIGGLGDIVPSIPEFDDKVKLSIGEIKNVKLDSEELVAKIGKLNNTIPNFDDAEKFVANAVGIPFDFVKEQINDKLGNYTFDRSIFPVADKEALTFCSENSFINDFFTTLFEIVAKAKITFIVVIVILSILAMFVTGYLDIRRWRREKERARAFTEHGYDPMDVVYMASRPFTAGLGVKIASKFRNSERRYLLVRWAIAYATSLPALFVLSLAFAGLFSCLCQYIMLKSIEKEAPALAGQVGQFAGSVVQKLEDVSNNWANGANGQVLSLQDDINQDVFGWVQNATTAVNNTLNVLETQVEKGLDMVFKDTVLYDTVKMIVGCVFTRKIESIEAGLNWVHENARVTFPLFPNDTFSQGAQSSVQGDSDLTSFLASPAAVTTDEITGAVDKVTNSLRSNIVQELLISLALLLVYVIVVLIGIGHSLFGMAFGREKTRAEGGHRYNITHPTHLHDDDGSNQSQHHHHRAPPPPPPAAHHEDSSPAYDDVVYAGSVPRGKTEVKSSSHARKSSYPEWEDEGHYPRHAR
ncbi:plasma membrane fusion protein PRM1 [Naviculisporaceae sp. PSN 640]